MISKSHQPGKWHVIVNLSHLCGYSVNDTIPKVPCYISYVTIDDDIQKIVELGPNALLAKMTKCGGKPSWRLGTVGA